MSTGSVVSPHACGSASSGLRSAHQSWSDRGAFLRETIGPCERTGEPPIGIRCRKRLATLRLTREWFGRRDSPYLLVYFSTSGTLLMQPSCTNYQTHLSPCCRSPAPFFRTRAWRVHKIAPTPDAIYPSRWRLAWRMALCSVEQVFS